VVERQCVSGNLLRSRVAGVGISVVNFAFYVAVSINGLSGAMAVGLWTRPTQGREEIVVVRFRRVHCTSGLSRGAQTDILSLLVPKLGGGALGFMYIRA
jgi:hypothetical protein